MAMLQRHAQSQRMQQKADPQLLLTNRILQMSVFELQQCLTQELSENPALESVEEHACGHCQVPGPQCLECPFSPSLLRSSSTRDDYRVGADGGLPRDEEPDPFAMVESPQTLQHHLHQQLGAAGQPGDMEIGHYLLANIDDDGYLRCSEEEAARCVAASVHEVERVLRLIQTFDPTGVGARSLQECLLLQARGLADDPGTPRFVEATLTRFWNELVSSKWRLMARGLKTSEAEVEQTVLWIRKNLHPYPGSGYRPSWEKNSHRSGSSIRSEVKVAIDEGGQLQLEVVSEELPVLHVSPHYARLWIEMRDRPESFSAAERKHVREYLMRAQMFLKGLQDRSSVLRLVAECIVSEQEQYFHSERDEEMRPLTQSRLATFLRVHESTVSRAIAEKFLQLPSGRVVPMSYFFDRALCQRKLVANVLATEDPKSPLSDQEISDILRRQGVQIARRTVMKYREEMNILSSRRRSRLGA